MKKIVIIGANSFLSQSLLKKIPKRHNILQVYNKGVQRIDQSYDSLTISDFIRYKPEIDVIYFVASYINFTEKYNDIENIYHSNVLLLKELSYLYPRAKIIHTSSVSVYETTTQSITELSKLNPKSSYGISKLWGELIVNNHKGGSVNVRKSSLFGEHMNCNTFLPLIIQNAIRHNNISIYGNGSRLQNYIYVEDVANILSNALEYNKKLPLLAVNKRSYSNLEIAHIIKSFIPNLEINYKGEDNSGDVNYDGNETMKCLKLTFSNNFKEQIYNTFLWIKKQY